MALLYLSMLTNAMWYGILPDKPGTGALKFGPFALSPEQVRRPSYCVWILFLKFFRNSY
jgi:hypothetical protein